jgi:hypothetical protein
MAIKPKFGYYPANFELEQFCSTYNFKPSQVVAFINIFLRNTQKKEYQDRLFLNAEILKNSIGKDYSKIIAALIQEEVILNTRGPEIGVHSNEFKLANNFSECLEFIEFEYVDESKPNLIKANKERQKSRYSKELKLPKLKRKTDIPYEVFSSNYRIVLNWIYHTKLEFNQDEAFKILEATGLKNSKKKKERNRYKYYWISIAGFKKDNIYATVDYNYRFYTNLTSLPKIFKRCLSFDGEVLEGYDIKGTHPVLIVNLCDTFFLKRLVKENAIEVDQTMFDAFIQHLESEPIDLLEYKKLVLSGLFYENLNLYLPHLTRDKIKKMYLEILNDANIDYNLEIGLIRRVLYENFPTIAFLLELLKSVNHKYTSAVLMSIEAQNFIIKFPEEMNYRLESQGIEPIPLFTIHDCFLTTKSKLPILKEQLEWYFDKYFGMKVPLKHQSFS